MNLKVVTEHSQEKEDTKTVNSRPKYKWEKNWQK